MSTLGLGVQGHVAKVRGLLLLQVLEDQVKGGNKVGRRSLSLNGSDSKDSQRAYENHGRQLEPVYFPLSYLVSFIFELRGMTADKPRF